MRSLLRKIQDVRWRLRKAEPNSLEALRFARRLAKAYKRWHDLYTTWVPGPSGYRPKPIRLMGWKPKPPHWDPPAIEGTFNDPLPPG